MKKTIKYLNNKIWYRALKVVFIITFLFSLFAGVITLYEEIYKTINEDKTTITCLSNNKTYTIQELRDINIIYYYTSLGFNSKIASFCEDKDLGFNNLLTEDGERYYEINRVYTHKHFWNWLPVVLIGIILVFEILRRIFYYIVLGALIPKKKDE